MSRCRCELNCFGDWSTGALYQVGYEVTSKVDQDKSDVSGRVVYNPYCWVSTLFSSLPLSLPLPLPSLPLSLPPPSLPPSLPPWLPPSPPLPSSLPPCLPPSPPPSLPSFFQEYILLNTCWWYTEAWPGRNGFIVYCRIRKVK